MAGKTIRKKTQAAVPGQQYGNANVTWKTGIWILVGIIVGCFVMFRGCGSSAPDKYTAAEYDKFLQDANQSVASHGMVYGKDFMIEWGGGSGDAGGSHDMLRITINTVGQATPRQYKDCADALADAYSNRFPDKKKVYVIVKDYQQMKTMHEDLYWW